MSLFCSYLVGIHVVIKDFMNPTLKTKGLLYSPRQDNKYTQTACEGTTCLVNKKLGSQGSEFKNQLAGFQQHHHP